jgi:hypothetical protein
MLDLHQFAERAGPVPAPLEHFKNYYCPEKLID